jgi:hypothetical protein
VIRRLRKSDVPKLRAIHAKVGYGFAFPELTGLIGAQVIEDDEGNVVGFAAGQLEAQIIGVFDSDWGTPGERMRVFGELHRPIAEKLEKQGVKEVYVAIDPKFPAFGRRMVSLGWRKDLWDRYFSPISDILRRFGKQASHF